MNHPIFHHHIEAVRRDEAFQAAFRRLHATFQGVLVSARRAALPSPSPAATDTLPRSPRTRFLVSPTNGTTTDEK